MLRPLSREKDPFLSKGFSLIEVMMVLVIAGFLFAIIVPKFMQNNLDAKIAKTKAGLEKLRTAIALFYAKEGRLPSDMEISSLADAYIGEIPAEGFTGGSMIKYGMDICGNGYFSELGGWCYAGDGRGGKIYPNLPNNDAAFGYENFGAY